MTVSQSSGIGMPVVDHEHQQYHQAERLETGDDDDQPYHTLTNIIGMALITALVGTGAWLAHAMADMSLRAG